MHSRLNIFTLTLNALKLGLYALIFCLITDLFPEKPTYTSNFYPCAYYYSSEENLIKRVPERIFSEIGNKCHISPVSTLKPPHKVRITWGVWCIMVFLKRHEYTLKIKQRELFTHQPLQNSTNTNTSTSSTIFYPALSVMNTNTFTVSLTVREAPTTIIQSPSYKRIPSKFYTWNETIKTIPYLGNCSYEHTFVLDF